MTDTAEQHTMTEIEQRANDLLAAVCKQREESLNAAAHWQADAIAAQRRIAELEARVAELSKTTEQS